MPIWSLTKERVDKLLAQVGDIEHEIDKLIKLTKEDLWDKDLNDFINEWRTQLQEEANMRKKIASMGRRESTKLKINAKVPGRKRKPQGEDADDSDFGTKGAARKPAPVKRAQPKSNMLSESPLAKPTVKSKPTASSKAKTLGGKTAPIMPEDTKPLPQASDGLQSVVSAQASDMPVAPIFQKAKTAAVSKKTAPVKKVKSEDEDDQESDAEIIRPAVSRKPREAAKKVPTYHVDDSDSNGDDMLLDVGKMVKGIGNASSDQATTTRPLFSASMSRPGSSSGFPKKSSSSSRQTMDLDGDDTDYSKLAPPPAAKRGISVTARKTVISDEDIDDVEDDDDDDFPHVNKKAPPPKAASVPKAPKVTAAKSAAQPKAKASVTAAAKKATKLTTSQPVKKPTLSPAAKAYAAKRSRNQRVLVDTDDDEANEGDGEDEVDRVANAILDEGNGDDDEEKDEIVIRRPARKAAAKAVEKVTKAWRDESEEDQEEDDVDDDEEDSAMFDDDDESE
jgi:DNA topoisomerase-2